MVQISKHIGACALCERTVPLTFHHLIPRKMHRRERFKKMYSREERNQGIHICRLCHNGIHALFDEMTLAKEFTTLKKLQEAPQVIKHVAWVRKQKTRM